MIQSLKKLPRPREELARRMKAALSDWVAYGHSESDIRRLVSGVVALQPLDEPEPTKKEKKR
jgi:hypothetical protein